MSGLLDVARQTFKEATEDVHQHVTEISRRLILSYIINQPLTLSEQCEMQAELRYDNARQYWLRVSELEFEGRAIPDVLVNRYRKKGYLQFQTLDLVKLNQRIFDSHNEVVLMSDKTIQQLLDDIRGEISSPFKVCEGIAMLDMIAAFGQLVTTQAQDYVRPEITDCLVIQAGRHPIKEKVWLALSG